MDQNLYKNILENSSSLLKEIYIFNDNFIKDISSVRYPPTDKNVSYSRVLSSMSENYNPKDKNIKYTKSDKFNIIDTDKEIYDKKISNIAPVISMLEIQNQLKSIHEKILKKNDIYTEMELVYFKIYYRVYQFDYLTKDVELNKQIDRILQDAKYKDLFDKYGI